MQDWIRARLQTRVGTTTLGHFLKYVGFFLGAICSAFALVLSYLTLSSMVSFPVLENVSGQMAHDFATTARLNWIISIVAAPVLVICVRSIGLEFLRNRKLMHERRSEPAGT